MGSLCLYTMCTRFEQPALPVRVQVAAPPLGGRSAPVHSWRNSVLLREGVGAARRFVRRCVSRVSLRDVGRRWWKSQRGV